MILLVAVQPPIVLLHGVTASASSMDKMQQWLEQENFVVFNCEIGNGAQNSINMPISWQAEQLALCIESHKDIQNGFIGVGHSQGGMIMRYYLQMLSHNSVKMLRLITLASPLAGYFCKGKEDCTLGLTAISPNLIYLEGIQNTLAPTNYWRDPTAYDKYVKGALALPVINNEREFSQQVKTNFMSIDKLVMFASPKDEIIRPWQSSFLGFFKNGSSTEIVDMEHTDVYLQDLYGLKTMNEQGRIVKIEVDSLHSEYNNNQIFVQGDLARQLRMDNQQQTSLSTGAIVGIILAVITVIFSIILIAILIAKQMKKQVKAKLAKEIETIQLAI
ncbi:Palmitoyl-protein thioesterase [Spironucleus salmonicida]|uniref:Palmitoyl-protein thioesterase 1 n=1 Tax=Spironucleus salmonicida TaxID=348837 RepID=V6LI14_9EUKA|nr:Palmitoyl-protein thioesterase [Spironucleus salmonicida]|eukprot:EST43351.1 Palmitoyl-protein thioesterase [Spironucleus salmonicida]